ncbi:hypothetical protein EGW08_008033 [Elysia chlorotica]|uniref:Uncharacterized protein n=1 Tax=Elysia chlorotica TaxID=188477 RepID=A0A433TRE8_ELYCH|nr:hypothetical protein EGW08_008033 [Elysia chlorotica]
MNFSQMSADLGMYNNNYMPPPPAYGGHVANQYSQQQLVTHQQPMVQHQQYQQHSNTAIQHNQQAMMQTQQYSIGSYSALHGGALPSKQSMTHTRAPAHDQGYMSQSQANQIQGHNSHMEWMNSMNIPPIPPLSPINNPTSQCSQTSPHQSMVVVQRRTSNPSPMQQSSYPPPLSPMQRLTPLNSQTSPGPQQFSQMAPAPDARVTNHVRRLSASSEFAHPSLSTSSASQSQSVHYAPSKISSQVHSLRSHPNPHAPQIHQGIFNNLQYTAASKADHVALQSSPYATTGLNGNHHAARQGSSSHPQLPHSNVYSSTQNFSSINQMTQVVDRLDPHHGSRDVFPMSKAPERQKEKQLNSVSNVIPVSSTRLPANNETHRAKTVAVNNVHSRFGFDEELQSHFHSVVGGLNNRGPVERPSFNLTSPSEQVSRQSALHNARQSWGGIKPSGPPQNQTTVNRGVRGNRRATSSRARGRGSTRGRGTAMGQGTAAPLVTPAPLQPMQWYGPPAGQVPSYQSDIEAMQAAVNDNVSHIQAKHPEESMRVAQSDRALPKSNMNGPMRETVQSSVLASHTSSSTTATHSTPPISSSRAAALEAIRIKQEAVEIMAKNKPEKSPSQVSHKQGKEDTPKTLKASNAQAVSNMSSCHSRESGSQQISLASNTSHQTKIQSVQSSNLPREKGISKSSQNSVSVDKGNHDSLAFLLDSSSSVQKIKAQNSTPSGTNPAIDQREIKHPKPPGKPINVNVVKEVNNQRIAHSGSKLNPKAHLQTVGKNPIWHPLTTSKHQNMALENKRPMTAKERVISMWRDGQVVGRTPTLLKRPAKASTVSQQPQQSEEALRRPQDKPFPSNDIAPQQNGNDTGVSNVKKFRPSPREEADTVSSKPSMDLYYIMFHGHKLICLKSAREKMLLLCQFQFECFPDKGMGSVNNCIDRSLRIKKKPLQHKSLSEIISYLQKNEYKIDTEVLTINLEDARRVYHHMYSIRNCVSASCVVELLDQRVNLCEDIPGSRKRTFQREILGRIKTESDPTDEQDPASQAHSAGQDKNGAINGSKKTGIAGDEDARSDCTVAYGADKANDDDDDDLVILRVEENPNLICYNGEGPKVGMLCNSLMGSVRSYVHNNEHYLVIEDLCRIFGSSDFNSLLDNQNITVYSCCSEIGAFLNQISDKFAAVSSFHECLVKEKDIGVQWANDQSDLENSTDVLSNRPCLKQEIVDEQTSCRAAKQPKTSTGSATSLKCGNSSESDLDSSEPRLQIDMDVSPKVTKGNVLITSSTSTKTVNQLSSGKGKAVNSSLIAEQSGSEHPVSSSPQSHSSADTMASTLVLDVTGSNTNENTSREEAVLKSSSKGKGAGKKQEKTYEVKRTTDDIDIFSSANSDPMGPSSVNFDKTKSYLVQANTQLCHRNRALIGIVMKLRNELTAVRGDLTAVKNELAVTKTAKDKAEKVSKHLEDALATMTSSFPFGNSSAPIVIDEDEVTT